VTLLRVDGDRIIHVFHEILSVHDFAQGACRLYVALSLRISKPSAEIQVEEAGVLGRGVGIPKRLGSIANLQSSAR